MCWSITGSDHCFSILAVSEKSPGGLLISGCLRRTLGNYLRISRGGSQVAVFFKFPRWLQCGVKVENYFRSISYLVLFHLTLGLIRRCRVYLIKTTWKIVTATAPNLVSLLTLSLILPSNFFWRKGRSEYGYESTWIAKYYVHIYSRTYALLCLNMFR